ncbi:MAG: DUF1571 domain-containing protein [Planctomycetaceae bacterium]
MSKSRPTAGMWMRVTASDCSRFRYDLLTVLSGLLTLLTVLTMSSEAVAQPTGTTSEQGRSPVNVAPEHPLVPAISMARESLSKLQGVRDYDCQFIKREMLGNQLQTHAMYMRCRQEPFSLYLKFGEPHAGREVMYVAGRNNNKLFAHEGSGVAALVGTMSLALNDPKITAENRHPLNEAGLHKMLELLIAQWENEAKYGEIEVQHYPEARIGKTAVRVIESMHPQPRRQFPYHITRLYLSVETGLPVRLENYAWPQRSGTSPILVEEYTYARVRPNLGLTEQQFDTRNPEYGF